MIDRAITEHELATFRQQKDAFFRLHPQSPLTPEQRLGFTGLAYFPFDPNLIWELPLEREGLQDVVELQTSTGFTQEYRRAGVVHFDVAGQPATLTIYEGEAGDLFLPLCDATSGSETYGGGRYLEPHLVAADMVLIDLNYLYNPYCAYSDKWNCPLPPRENWLTVPIRAGERQFE